VPNPLKAIAAAAERITLGPPGARFVDVIPAAAILDVPLADIELAILRSVNTVKRGAAFSEGQAIKRWASSYPSALRVDVELRITEAWQSLNNAGLIAETTAMGVYETWFVTQKGRAALDSETTSYGQADLLPIGLLLPRLASVVVPLYSIGRFDDACAAAFKQLEILVRELCGFTDDVVGIDLMRQSFTPDIGPLTLTDSPKAEQIAVRDLFAGAMGYFRNPLAHRDVGITSAAHGASTILVANELMAIATRHHRIRHGVVESADE
jgi:uncharacterized protein (TIGR02391 family)